MAIFGVTSLFIACLSLISIAWFIDNQNSIILLKLYFIMRPEILQYFASGIKEVEDDEKNGNNDVHPEDVLQPFIPENVGDY